MILMYINEKDIKKSLFIKYIDNEFNAIMYNLKIDKNDIDYMQRIDAAKYLGNGYIETHFGRTTLDNLSTGCKTLILLNHFKDKVINIQECGANALDIIYNNMDNISIYTKYELHPTNYKPFLKVELLKNGTKSIKTLSQVFEKM